MFDLRTRQAIARASDEALEHLLELVQDEIDRRDYDASDPASPRNTATDARDDSIELGSYGS